MRFLDTQSTLFAQYRQHTIIQPNDCVTTRLGDYSIHFPESLTGLFNRPSLSVCIDNMHTAVDTYNFASKINGK